MNFPQHSPLLTFLGRSRPSSYVVRSQKPNLDSGYVHITPFSFWSVFGSKNGAVFFSVHTTPFSDRNGYLSIGVHTISQKRICSSLSDNEAFKASDIGVFKLFRFWWSHYRVSFIHFHFISFHISMEGGPSVRTDFQELRFCLAPFSFSSVFIIVFIYFRFWGGLMWTQSQKRS